MTINSRMMAEVVATLRIPKESTETDEHWHKRIAISLTGGHMLAALYDFDETVNDTFDERTNVSKQHILKRGEELLSIFGVCSDEQSRKTLEEKMREQFIALGFMLQKSNKLTFPPRISADSYGISFVRGIPPWANLSFSGIGTFLSAKCNSGISVERMFGLDEHNLADWFANFNKRLNWRSLSCLPSDVEYLNISENTKGGYWQKNPPKRGLTLYRTKGVGEPEYAMLQIETLAVSVLPSWLVKGGEYRRIAIALRSANKNAPSVGIECKEHTAEIVIDYLLPNREQEFFEVYSWATYGDSRWKRTIVISLEPTFRCLFEKLGYTIIEV